jgi:hypothetical protein
MTDIEREQLAALAAQRQDAVAADLRAVGFQVLSVQSATFGWRVNVSVMPKTEKTIRERCEKAGYSLRRYGVDDDGLFMIVE